MSIKRPNNTFARSEAITEAVRNCHLEKQGYTIYSKSDWANNRITWYSLPTREKAPDDYVYEMSCFPVE